MERERNQTLFWGRTEQVLFFVVSLFFSFSLFSVQQEDREKENER